MDSINSKAMKNLIYCCFFTLLAQIIFAQSRPDFTIGSADSIHSKILNENRPLLIYTPYAAKKIKPSTKEIYPVLYVLDGEAHFRFVAEIVERLINTDACPPMIVVGVVNTNRNRDLTTVATSGNTDGISNTGGGEQFISFLEKELIPYMERNYPTAPYKILMGHSLGGLIVMQSLVHHKDLFNAYIAIDAAIWWDEHKILTEAKLALTKENYENKKLFLAMANRMERGVDTTAVQLDKDENTELIRYNIDLMHFIKKHPKSNLSFKAAYYENESHGTVPFIAAYDGLRYLFDYYEFPRYSDYTTDNPLVTTLVKNHYSTISKHLGYQVLPPSSLVNNLGYRALHYKQFRVAKQLFEMNTSNFPQDSNLMDSQGDYYKAVGDQKNAIYWYQKALGVIEIKETRAKLNELLNEKK